MTRAIARRGWSLLAVAGVAVVVTGCSLSHGRTQLVHVRSAPPGAQVSVNGVAAGETPVHVSVRRRDAGPVLRVEKAGFAAVDRELDRGFSGWFLAEVAVGGLLGWVGTSSSVSRDLATAYAALGVWAVLAPGLATGSAYRFPSGVDVMLAPAGRVDAGTGADAALKRPLSVDLRGDPGGLRSWLEKWGTVAGTAGWRARMRAARDGRGMDDRSEGGREIPANGVR